MTLDSAKQALRVLLFTLPSLHTASSRPTPDLSEPPIGSSAQNYTTKAEADAAAKSESIHKIVLALLCGIVFVLLVLCIFAIFPYREEKAEQIEKREEQEGHRMMFNEKGEECLLVVDSDGVIKCGERSERSKRDVGYWRTVGGLFKDCGKGCVCVCFS